MFHRTLFKLLLFDDVLYTFDEFYRVAFGWSVFAYIWLYLIIQVISYKYIELWEGILTFMFFPIFVIHCYLVDSRLLQKSYRRYVLGDKKAFAESESEGENIIHQLIEIMKNARETHPDASPDEIVAIAETEMLKKAPKSQAFYRLQANSKMLGGGDLIKKHEQEQKKKSKRLRRRNEDVLIHFEDPDSTCMENVGTHHLNVVCARFKGSTSPIGLFSK